MEALINNVYSSQGSSIWEGVAFLCAKRACSDRMPLSRHPLVEITHRLLS